MRTVVPDPPPVEFAQLLERRRRTGVDRRDEVWEGVLHMAPAPHSRHARLQWQLAELLGPAARAAGLEPSSEFNLGEPNDYRIPDGGLHHGPPDGLYLPTVAVAIEILSPGDETLEKLPFYGAHQVRELLIIDPAQRSVQWLALGSDREYHRAEGSALIALTASELSGQIDWPR
jgi:Uma2 family endonuclease